MKRRKWPKGAAVVSILGHGVCELDDVNYLDLGSLGWLAGFRDIQTGERRYTATRNLKPLTPLARELLKVRE